MDVIEPKEFID